VSCERVHDAGLEWLLADVLRVGSGLMMEALRGTWPGRLEVMQSEPLVVLDGARDPEAVKALTATVRRHFSYRRIISVVSVSSDKNMSEMVSTLA
jgi:dihydrofolate synthase / folylpolyglutamate synthase